MTRDVTTGDWGQTHELSSDRDYSCIWAVEEGLILIGGGPYGSSSRTTSEMARYDGGVEQTFDLKYKTL